LEDMCMKTIFNWSTLSLFESIVIVNAIYLFLYCFGFVNR